MPYYFLKTMNFIPMKFQLKATIAAAAAPIFAHTSPEILLGAAIMFTTKEAVPTLIIKPIKLTKKNFTNSIGLGPPTARKVQYLFQK